MEYLQKCDERYQEEFHRCLVALFEHFQIDTSKPGALAGLVLSMAEEFVPAFRRQPPKKRGPKLKWDQIRYTQLAADVELVKRQNKCGDLQACRILVKRTRKAGKGRYLPKKNVSDETAAKSLNSRLVEARDSMNSPFGIAARAIAEDQRQAMTDLLIDWYGSTEIRD
jgi:hypothetical protein